MSDVINKASWDAVKDILGPEGAEGFRTRNNLAVEGYGKTPMASSDDDGSGLAVAGTTDDDADTAPLAVSGMYGSPANRAAAIARMYGEQTKGLSDLYDRATEVLKQQYAGAGPTQNERLLALGSALLQPTATGSFGASLANVGPAMLQQAQAKRQEQMAARNALFSLQLDRAKTLGTLGGKYLTAAAKPIRSAIDPSSGMVKNLDTGELITPPGTNVLEKTPEGLAKWNSAPSGTEFFVPEKNGYVTKP